MVSKMPDRRSDSVSNMKPQSMNAPAGATRWQVLTSGLTLDLCGARSVDDNWLYQRVRVTYAAGGEKSRLIPVVKIPDRLSGLFRQHTTAGDGVENAGQAIGQRFEHEASKQ